MGRSFCLAIVLTVAAGAAGAAEVSYFLKIPGIEGESHDDAYHKWIDLIEVDLTYRVRTDEEGESRVIFGDGEHGRRPPTGDGDPDQPIIVGSVPNPEHVNEHPGAALTFTVAHHSPAVEALYKVCRSGKHFSRVELQHVVNEKRAARYQLFGVQCRSLTDGSVAVTSQQFGERARFGPTVSMSANCVQRLSPKPKSTPCPAASKRKSSPAVVPSKDIVLKGKKILEN